MQNIESRLHYRNACIDKTPEVVRVNNEIQVKIGQGDGETKWYGWAWKLLLVKFVILFIYLFIYLLIY